MARESAARPGRVGNPAGEASGYPDFDSAGFTLGTPSGFAFRYDQGAGVTIDAPKGSDPAEEILWLRGSVHAAIASFNGLMPIHASAVACHGKVYAFTGPSGAGKSTLTAALGCHGLPLFCDDTLVLDIADPGNVLCLPGHKRLKLTDEALRLTGAAAEETVGAKTGKFYARPVAGTTVQVLPLAELCFLEDGPKTELTAISGAKRVARLNDDHYTATIFARARDLDPARRFALLASLAPAVAMTCFVRPRDPAQFADGVEMVAAHIRKEIR